MRASGAASFVHLLLSEDVLLMLVLEQEDHSHGLRPPYARAMFQGRYIVWRRIRDFVLQIERPGLRPWAGRCDLH